MRLPALVVAVLLALVGCGAQNEPAPAVTPPAGAASSPLTHSATYVPPPDEITEPNPPTANDDGDLLRIPDGNYVAGSDIAPGWYRSTGLAPDRAICSWSVATQYDERRGVASGTLGVTIASGISEAPDVPQRFAIEEGQQLTTAGCADWLYYGP